jgi:hypothetical protein
MLDVPLPTSYLPLSTIHGSEFTVLSRVKGLKVQSHPPPADLPQAEKSKVWPPSSDLRPPTSDLCLLPLTSV